jgi:nitroimidazol reductase NimA-like FMN-containing flavoprotein (pyridoxamine 5'-phosphate oxidase superfamily)
MRRKDKEIQRKDLLDQVIAKAQVCRLGLCKNNTPYIVPLSFGYDGTSIYFHTATEGMKLDYIAANNRVCFEFEHEVRVVPDENEACKWSFSFYSVIGFGTVEEIVEPPLKVYALNQIMQHYSGKEWHFDEHLVKKVRLWSISIAQITGKQSKDKIAI